MFLHCAAHSRGLHLELLASHGTSCGGIDLTRAERACSKELKVCSRSSRARTFFTSAGAAVGVNSWSHKGQHRHSTTVDDENPAFPITYYPTMIPRG